MNLVEFAYEGVRVLLNLKETSVSLSVADREVYAFDIEGKPLSFWMNGKTFVWTVDCRVIKKWRDAESHQKQIQEADPNERHAILRQAHSRLAELQSALQRGDLQFVRSDDSVGNPIELIEPWLAKFLTWDAARCEEQRRAFASHLLAGDYSSPGPVLDTGTASDSRLPLEPLHLLRLLSDGPLPHPIDGGV